MTRGMPRGTRRPRGRFFLPLLAVLQLAQGQAQSLQLYDTVSSLADGLQDFYGAPVPDVLAGDVGRVLEVHGPGDVGGDGARRVSDEAWGPEPWPSEEISFDMVPELAAAEAGEEISFDMVPELAAAEGGEDALFSMYPEIVREVCAADLVKPVEASDPQCVVEGNCGFLKESTDPKKPKTCKFQVSYDVRVVEVSGKKDENKGFMVGSTVDKDRTFFYSTSQFKDTGGKICVAPTVRCPSPFFLAEQSGESDPVLVYPFQDLETAELAYRRELTARHNFGKDGGGLLVVAVNASQALNVSALPAAETRLRGGVQRCVKALPFQALSMTAVGAGTTLLAADVEWTFSRECTSSEGKYLLNEEVEAVDGSRWQDSFKLCAAACRSQPDCKAFTYPTAAKAYCRALIDAVCKPGPGGTYLVVAKVEALDGPLQCKEEWIAPPTTTHTSTTTSSTQTTTTTLAWLRILWNRTGTISQHVAVSWQSEFKFLSSARPWSSGDEVRLLPRRALDCSDGRRRRVAGNFIATVEDCETGEYCNGTDLGRIVQVLEGGEVDVRWYRQGIWSRTQAYKTLWFTSEVPELAAGDEVMLITTRNSTDFIGVNAGDRGRVREVKETASGVLQISIVWYSSKQPGSYTFINGTWWDRFQFMAKAEDLQPRFGDLLQALPGAAGPRGQYAAGDEGRVSNIQGGTFLVTWLRTGSSTEHQLLDWYTELKLESRAIALEFGDILQVLPTKGSPQGYADGEQGNIIKLTDEELVVKWHKSGNVSRDALESWPAHFMYVGKPPTPGLGDELQTLPRLEGHLESLVAGKKGRTAKLTQDSLCVVHYETGAETCVNRSTWFGFFLWVKQAPVLASGMELGALPGDAYAQSCSFGRGCKHKAGDVGRVLLQGTRMSIRWYKSGSISVVDNSTWFATYQLVGEAATLSLGARLRSFPGEALDGSRGKGSNFEDAGWVYSVDIQTVSAISEKTGLSVKLQSDSWYHSVIFTEQVLEIQFADEVQILPSPAGATFLQGWQPGSGEVKVVAGELGRVGARPEVPDLYYVVTSLTDPATERQYSRATSDETLGMASQEEECAIQVLVNHIDMQELARRGTNMVSCKTWATEKVFKVVRLDYDRFFGKGAASVTWYKSGKTTIVKDALHYLQFSEEAHALQLGEELEVLPGFALEGPGGASYSKSTCEPGDRGRLMPDDAEPKAYFEVTFYRTGRRARCRVDQWPQHFKLVGPAVALQPGVQLEAFAGSSDAEGKYKGGDKGCVLVADYDEDTLKVKWFNGAISITRLQDWFVHFKATHEVHTLTETEELEVLPDPEQECGAVRGGWKGRVTRFGDGHLDVAWYDKSGGESKHEGLDQWYLCFKPSAPAHDLAELELVESLAPGAKRPGRIANITGEQVHVAWHDGGDSEVPLGEWMRKLKFVSEAVRLERGCELSIRPRLRGGAMVNAETEKQRGRVINDLDKAEIVEVMLYTGQRFSGDLAQWTQWFIYEDKARRLATGNEIRAINSSNSNPDAVTKYDPGFTGRVVSTDQDNFTAVWYDNGLPFKGSMSTCFEYFQLTKVEGEPALTVGSELAVLPNQFDYAENCKPVYRPGWTGRVTEKDPTGSLCIRWYEHTERVCFLDGGWMRHFRYLGKAHDLRLGDEVALIAGEKCPLKTSLPDEALSSETSLRGIFPWRFVRSHEGAQGRFLAQRQDTAGCELVPGQEDNMIKLTYMVDRGRITDISQGQICITWYIGFSSCDGSLNKWIERYQFTSKATNLTNDAVVEVLPTEEAKVWGEDKESKEGRWGVVTQADDDKLCVQWNKDGKEKCVYNQLRRWERSLRLISTKKDGTEQFAMLAKKILVRSNMTEQIRGIIPFNAEGVVGFVGETRFCVSWLQHTCCTCHDEEFLKNMSLVVLGKEKSAPPNSCDDKGEESQECTASTRQEEASLAVAAVVSVLVGLPITLLILWLLKCIGCQGTAPKKYLHPELEIELSDLTTEEVRLPFISYAGASAATATASTDSEAALHRTSSEEMLYGASLTGFDHTGKPAVGNIAANSKFNKDMVPCLRSGEAGAAATGLKEFLAIPSEKMSELHHNALEAIENEWDMCLEDVGEREDMLGVPEEERKAGKLRDLFDYIIHGTADEIEEHSNDGHSTVTRDKGNKGMTLADFHQKEQAMKAKLSLAEVAALRIYTSELFQYINPPFRKPENRDGFKDPHPVGVTVVLISDGLKKLRTLNAGRNNKVCFWRGMKDLSIPEEFEEGGGTELQCMSTTESIEIAAAYGRSEYPLIFCVQSDSFMTRGADISWLSLYPHEKEILYPPLTYLQFLSKRKIVNSNGFVVYVKPIMG